MGDGKNKSTQQALAILHAQLFLGHSTLFSEMEGFIFSAMLERSALYFFRSTEYLHLQCICGNGQRKRKRKRHLVGGEFQFFFSA